MAIRKVSYAVLIALLAILVMASGAVTGCKKQPEKTTGKDVGKEVGEAAQAIGDYATEKGDQFLKDIDAAVNDLDNRTKTLEQRVTDDWDKMDKATQDEVQRLMDQVRVDRKKIAALSDEVNKSSGTAKEDLKKSLQIALDALKNDIARVEEQLSKTKAK